MSIRNVGGARNVYVIDAEVPRAKDSKGKGYGSLYTDLRWELWSQVQQSALQEMKFDNDLYMAQLEAINDQIAQQRELVANLQSGALEAQDAAELDRLKYTKAMKEAAARQRFSETVSSGTTAPSAASMRAGELEAKDKQLLDDAVARASVDAPDSIGRYAQRLEARVVDALGPGSGVNPDSHELLRRDAVADAVSKARAAATNAGLDPADAEAAIVGTFSPSFQDAYLSSQQAPAGLVGTRSSRTVSGPTYKLGEDDFAAPEVPVADRTAEAQRLMEELEELEAQRAGLRAPGTDLLQRTRDEFATRIGPGGFGTDIRPQRRQELFDEQRALRDVDKIMEARSALDNAERELISRRTKVMQEADILGGGEIAGAQLQDIDNRLAELRRRRSKLSRDPVLYGDFLRDGPSTRPLDNDDDEVPPDSPPDSPPDPPRYGSSSSSASGSMNFGSPSLAGLGGNLEINRPLEEQASELSPEQVIELEMLGITPKGVTEPESATEPVTEPVTKTPAQEQGSYKLRVLREAAQLANQAKKFERLTKPKLERSERQNTVPEYVILVERLYETNQASGIDPIKPTYAEIKRVYKDNEQAREDAHKFLFALDMRKKRELQPV